MSLMNSETELKYYLSSKDFRFLKKHLARFPHDTQIQTNYYFDSKTLILKRQKIGLRIRISLPKKPIVTLKFPKKNRNKLSALKVRHEYEESISPLEAKAVLRGATNICELNVTPIRELQVKTENENLNKIIKLGSIKTERTTYHYSNGMILELDKFTFFGKTFYELEVETSQPQKADKQIRELFRGLKIQYRPEEKSKLARFLKEWKQQKKA